jgi:hypothetical protein
MLKIEKDIPLPPRQRGKGYVAEHNYPWDKMEVGDSFFVPGDLVRQRNRAEVSYYNWKRRWNIEAEDFKIESRAVDNGIRVWRVK